MKTWHGSGDINFLDYGGVWTRHVAGSRYHVVVLDNMDEACGSDNEGQPRYAVELREVDLSTAPIKAALESCGPYPPDPDLPPLAVAECVSSYGAAAPLWSDSGNNGHKLVREAKRQSRELAEDEDAYEAAMSRPVNALGSTAREYGRGDFDSALSRGLASGSRDAAIMAQMQAPAPRGPVAYSVTVSAVPSDDPLAYSMGFVDAFLGKSLPDPGDGDSLADAYTKGRTDGAETRIFGRPLPTWLS